MASHDKSSPPEKTSQTLDSIPTITCPQCDAMNLAAHKFCGKCGTELWLECPQCQATYAATERFCGNCGTNVKEAFQHDFSYYEGELQEARDLIRRYQFDDAAHVLRPLQLVNDPRMESIVRSANDERERLDAEREKWASKCERMVAEVNAHIDACDYQVASDLRDSIPLALRTEEFEKALARATQFADEVKKLESQIVDDYKSKRLELLSTRIDRLNELKPGHKHALKLGKELRDRICYTARKKLKQHQFEKAASLLDFTPQVVLDGEVEKLSLEANELLWLKQSLEKSPAVDPWLVEIATRLATAAPDFPHIGEVVSQARTRLQQAPQPPWLASAEWRKPDRSNHALPFPVHHVGGFRRIQYESSEQAADYRPCADRSFVATGLALHGLGQHRLPMSLRSGKKGGLLGGIGRRKAKAAWGIDFSTTAIKAVRLELRNDAVMLSRFGEVRLPQVQQEDQQVEVAAECLGKLHQQIDLSDAPRTVSLPGYSLISKFVDLPPADGKKSADALKYEAAHQFPLPLDELIWGHEIVSAGTRIGSQKSLLSALRRTEFEKWDQRVFKPSKLTLDEIHPDGAALTNFVAYEHGEEFLAKLASSSNAGLMFADVGATYTIVAIIAPNLSFYRKFSLGGEAINTVIARRFQVRLDQAEQLKRAPDKIKRFHQLYNDFIPHFENIRDDINKSIQICSDTVGPAKVERLYLGGGAARMHGLLRHISIGE